MSCPDWRALTERRNEGAKGRSDGAEWRLALRHLDACPACQDEAPAADPTLLFRRLPALEAGRDEIESMKQAVAGMRRGRTIEHRREPRLPASWARAAALAAVLLGSLLLRGAGTPPDAPPTISEAAKAAATAASEVDLRRLPLIETVDPSYGSIIQVVDDDISVVLVVPSEIDV